MPDDAAAPKTPRAMTTAEVMLAGGVSGVAARLLTHPMDTVKTQMQVQGAVAAAGGNRALHYRGVADAVAKIVANEGVRGFYRGFGAVFTGIPFASGAYFGGYEGAKMLVPADAFGPTATYIVTGMLAQSLAGVVYTPLDVVKERLQAQHVLGAASAGNYKHFANAYATILRTEGVGGLFRGYWASNFTWWPWNVAYFVSYEHGRDFVAQNAMGLSTKDELPPWASSGCARRGGGGGGARTSRRHHAHRPGQDETSDDASRRVGRDCGWRGVWDHEGRGETRGIRGVVDRGVGQGVGHSPRPRSNAATSHASTCTRPSRTGAPGLGDYGVAKTPSVRLFPHPSGVRACVEPRVVRVLIGARFLLPRRARAGGGPGWKEHPKIQKALRPCST